jgi:hypothetical protein
MKLGRPRKFKLGTIVTDKTTEELYVIVDHHLRGTKSEYRCVPTNGRYERFGRAAWIDSSRLESIGKKSSKGSLVTYRANQMLEAEVGRECLCECCVHVSMPRKDFNMFTGEMRDLDEVSDE